MALPEKGPSGGGMRASGDVSQVRRLTHAAVDHLLVTAGHGDLDAFASFYDHTAPIVLGLVRGALGKEPDVAEQAMARAYLHVWRIAPTFHPSDGPAMALLLASAWRELTARRGNTRPEPCPPSTTTVPGDRTSGHCLPASRSTNARGARPCRRIPS